MAEIRPFRAVRPAAAYADRMAALPYDVYDEKEARKAVEGKPLSFLCIDRGETQLPEGTDPYSPEVYEKAAELYRREKEEGYFLKEESPCYYIYALTMEGRTQTGLAACSSVDDYLQGICKKHENTVQKKEEKPIYAIGKYRFLPMQHLLCYGEERQILTPKESKVLEMLCCEMGNLVSREMILTAIWQNLCAS